MSSHVESQDALTVETFYGINTVECVTLKGGVLRKYVRGLPALECPLPKGRSAQTEIVIVWHLTDRVSFRDNADEGQRRWAIKALEDKSAKMKGDQQNVLGGSIL